MSIVVSGALLPSPNRICRTADRKYHVNYAQLHLQTVPKRSLSSARSEGVARCGVAGLRADGEPFLARRRRTVGEGLGRNPTASRALVHKRIEGGNCGPRTRSCLACRSLPRGRMA
jgi:hypothetical protein